MDLKTTHGLPLAGDSLASSGALESAHPQFQRTSLVEPKHCVISSS
jgi:hypothetical protein